MSVTAPQAPLGLTVAETAQTLHVSETSVRMAIRNGELPAVRLGRRLIVPRAGLERILSGQSATRDECENSRITTPRR